MALGRGQVGGGCLGASGAWGMSPYTHTCTHMHTHACKHMYRNCKWPLTWRHPCLSCLSLFSMHVCACMCAWDTLLHTHTHSHSYPPICHPPGGTPGISQNSITLEVIKIFQFCLKIRNLWRILHPWVGA